MSAGPWRRTRNCREVGERVEWIINVEIGSAVDRERGAGAAGNEPQGIARVAAESRIVHATGEIVRVSRTQRFITPKRMS